MEANLNSEYGVHGIDVNGKKKSVFADVAFDVVCAASVFDLKLSSNGRMLSRRMCRSKFSAAG